MSLAVSGVIGALCALAVGLIIVVIVILWRRRARQRDRRSFADTLRSSYIAFYKPPTEPTISSFAGTGSFASHNGSRTASLRPPLSALRTRSSIELEQSASVPVPPKEPGESTLSLPDNLYMPVPVETSPADESSHMLQALYSDISRQKHSNPTSYHSNVEWWRRVLELLVSTGMQSDSASRLSLTCGPRLMELVRVQGVGKPLALGAVVTELQSSKILIPRNDFLNAQKSIYDPGWLPARIAAYIVGKPLWWALEQMGVVGEEGMLGGGGSPRSHKDTLWWGEYVFVTLLEAAADEIVKRQADRLGGAGDRLYSLNGFKQEFGPVVSREGALTEGDAMALLRFLERDRSCVVFDKEVVKFLSDDPSDSREINAVDRGILELRGAVQSLHVQVDGLQRKMDEKFWVRCTQKASAAVQQKRKPIALSHLRLRKELEDLLSKRLGSLDNLEATLLRVEAAAGDIEIMKSYESSTTTLRAILAHPSLQKDSIDATLDALADVNADAKEVDDAVRIGADVVIGVDTIDDGELEEELKALVLESEKEKKEQGELEKERELSERLGAVGKVPSVVSLPSGEAVKSKVLLN
ncbi:hypothetical protein H0H87_002881 [Tephrocybe sp. NHM501043]|nr:hypothetical protein H0H87_002881 [Tephrocybe sp. NHM501043]